MEMGIKVKTYARTTDHAGEGEDYYLPVPPPVQRVPPGSCDSGGPVARPDTAAVAVTRPACC